MAFKIFCSHSHSRLFVTLSRACKLLFSSALLHNMSVFVLYRFWDILRRMIACVPLKFDGLGVTQRDWRRHHSIDCISSYSSSIVTVAISCIVSKIKRHNGWKSLFFHSHLLHNNAWGKRLRMFLRFFSHVSVIISKIEIIWSYDAIELLKSSQYCEDRYNWCKNSQNTQAV